MFELLREFSSGHPHLCGNTSGDVCWGTAGPIVIDALTGKANKVCKNLGLTTKGSTYGSYMRGVDESKVLNTIREMFAGKTPENYKDTVYELSWLFGISSITDFLEITHKIASKVDYNSPYVHITEESLTEWVKSYEAPDFETWCKGREVSTIPYNSEHLRELGKMEHFDLEKIKEQYRAAVHVAPNEVQFFEDL
jgi:hypothetical protein